MTGLQPVQGIMSGGKPGGISFSLGKGKKGFVKPISSDTDEKKSDIEFMTSIQGTTIETSGGVVKDIQPNRLVIPVKSGNDIGQKVVKTEPVAEIAYSPKTYGLQVRRKKTGTELSPTPYSVRSLDDPIPSAQRSSRPTDQQKFNEDMVVLPEAPTKNSYKSIPVEAFGLAMLRGMGWDEETSKRTAKESKVPKQRPAMLGLGAKEGDPNLIKRPDYITARPKFKAQEERIVVGSRVRITSGEHSDLDGKIVHISKETAKIVLSTSAETVQVDVGKIILHSEKTSSTIKEATFQPIDGVYPSIKVRVASKLFRDGSLYLKKGSIIDVHIGNKLEKLSTIRFDDGKTIQDIPQSVLVPIIPQIGGQTLILSGTYSGHHSVLLAVDNKSAEGSVQLIDDESIILTLPLTSIASV